MQIILIFHSLYHRIFHFIDFEPPKSSQPFIAKVPRDLKLNYWVKVITPEGKVVIGRVKYVGWLPGKGEESFVGVHLGRSDGNSDGSYGGRRFFDWYVLIVCSVFDLTVIFKA